jgi:hypothetical protein
LTFATYYGVNVLNSDKESGGVIECTVERKKVRGRKVKQKFFITDKLCREKFLLYYSLLQEWFEINKNLQDGDRLFRKILMKKAGGQIMDKMFVGKQVVGVNTIAEVGKDIAKWLQRDDYTNFTAHCFRRSGSTLMANSLISKPLLQVAGNWKSDKAAEKYIAESEETKTEIANKIKFSDEASGDLKRRKGNEDSPILTGGYNFGANNIGQQIHFHGPVSGLTFGSQAMDLRFPLSNFSNTEIYPPIPVPQQPPESAPQQPLAPPPQQPAEMAPKLTLRISRAAFK